MFCTSEEIKEILKRNELPTLEDAQKLYSNLKYEIDDCYYENIYNGKGVGFFIRKNGNGMGIIDPPLDDIIQIEFMNEVKSRTINRTIELRNKIKSLLEKKCIVKRCYLLRDNQVYYAVLIHQTFDGNYTLSQIPFEKVSVNTSENIKPPLVKINLQDDLSSKINIDVSTYEYTYELLKLYNSIYNDLIKNKLNSVYIKNLEIMVMEDEFLYSLNSVNINLNFDVISAGIL